jgi:epoxide hydrolase 4
VAHDWGAAIGFKYVATHMDTIDKYIMIGAPPIEVLGNFVRCSVRQFLMSSYFFFFQMPVLPEFVLNLKEFRSIKRMRQSEEDTRVHEFVFSKKGAMTGPINYYRASIGLILTEKPFNRPTSFAPGLFLLGDDDKYISQDSGAATQKYYENLEYKVVEGAKHFAQQCEPEKINRLIRDFIKRK